VPSNALALALFFILLPSLAFFSGNFSDEVDVDFFGFREMGLGDLRVPNSLVAPGAKSKFQMERLANQL